MLWFTLFILSAYGFEENTWGCPSSPKTVPLPTGALGDAFNSVKDYISSLVLSPEISVGVVYDQDLVFHCGFSLNSTKTPPSPETAFRIGSITKVFTALSVFMMQEKGLLKVDDEVSLLFPVFSSFNNPWKTKRGITWRDLLSHRSGLARDGPCQALWGECNATLDETIQIVKDWPAVTPTSSRPSYSNLAFTLAGNLATSLDQTSFPEWMLNNAFLPLGMEHTGFCQGTQPPPYLVPGHEAGFLVPHYDFGVEQPAGGMYSSAKDLSKFISMMFRDEVPIHSRPDQLLDGATIREFLDPVWVGAGPSPLVAMGYSWEFTGPRAPLEDYWLRGKKGAVMGYTSQILMVPELKLGVIVLLNSGVGGKVIGVTETIMNIVAPKLKEVLARLAMPPPLPPTLDIVGFFVGKDVGFQLPPFVQGINATVTKTKDSNGNARLELTITTRMFGQTGPLLNGYLDFSSEESSDTVQNFVLKNQEAQTCVDETGGRKKQWVSFDTENGTMRVDGLYYGFVFFHSK